MELRRWHGRQLDIAKLGRTFDEVNARGQAIALCRPERIARQRAPAGTKLDIMYRLLAPGPDPYVGQPEPD